MKYSQKAQISLVKSVLLYGAKAFVLIYGLLLIFFSLSEITTALIKSRSFGVDFMIFVKPMLILLPTLLSVAVPYVFLITLFLVIRKLKQNNFFQFTTIYPTVLRYLVGAGLLISFFLSGIIYMLQDNVVNKFDTYIEKEIRNIKSRPLSSLIEPLKFTEIDGYTIYLPFVPIRKNSRELKVHIYKFRNKRVAFLGRGTIKKNFKGNIYLSSIWGFDINSKLNIKAKLLNKRYLLFNQIQIKKTIRKYIAQYKNFISGPSIPVLVGSYISPDNLNKLSVIKEIQKYWNSISPIIIIIFVYLLLYKKKYSISLEFYLYLFFGSCLWLIFPYLLFSQSIPMPEHFWIFIFGIVLFIFFFNKKFQCFALAKKNFLMKKFYPFKSLVIRIYLSIKNKSFYIFHLSKWKNRRKIFSYFKLYSRILKKFIYSISVVCFFIFFFKIFLQFIFLFKLNKNNYNISKYFIVQLFRFPEFFLSISPYLMIMITPMFILYISNRGFLTRFLLSGKSTLPIIFLIYCSSTILSCIFFLIREESFEWKIIADKYYKNYFNANYKKNKNADDSYQGFIQLEPSKILYYFRAQKSDNRIGESRLIGVFLDNLDDGDFIVSYRAKAYSNNLLFGKGTIVKKIQLTQNKKKISYNKDNFHSLNLTNLDINDLLLSKGNILLSKTKLLRKMISKFERYSGRTKNYLINIYITRLLSFTFLIIIFLFNFIYLIKHPKIYKQKIFFIIIINIIVLMQAGFLINYIADYGSFDFFLIY